MERPTAMRLRATHPTPAQDCPAWSRPRPEATAASGCILATKHRGRSQSGVHGTTTVQAPALELLQHGRHLRAGDRALAVEQLLCTQVCYGSCQLAQVLNILAELLRRKSKQQTRLAFQFLDKEEAFSFARMFEIQGREINPFPLDFRKLIQPSIDTIWLGRNVFHKRT